MKYTKRAAMRIDRRRPYSYTKHFIADILFIIFHKIIQFDQHSYEGIFQLIERRLCQKWLSSYQQYDRYIVQTNWESKGTQRTLCP